MCDTPTELGKAVYDHLLRQLTVAVVGLLIVSGAQAATIRDLADVTAKAAIVVDNRTGKVQFARNPNLRLPPASTTKVLTALVVLEGGDLERNVPVSRYASKMQPSKIWLRPGWVLNIEDLLYAILLKSANDASVVLAEGIAGSVPKFAERMNATARALGATRSHFVNPNGLPAGGHVSTVHDLARIMHHGLKSPQLRKILSTRSIAIRPREGSNRRITLKSKNRFLGRADMQVIGKTGWTRRAGRCFVGAATADGREILVAVLGSKNLWEDLERLIQYGLNEATPQPQWSGESAWQEAARSALGSPAEGDKSDELTPLFLYHVQLAAFRSEARANVLLQDVLQLGYSGAVEPARDGPAVLYRVRVRNFRTRASAREAAHALAKALKVEPLIVAVRYETSPSRRAGSPETQPAGEHLSRYPTN